MPSFIRPSAPTLLLASTLALCTASRPADAAWCSIAVDYQGISSVHLSYVVPPVPPTVTQVRLVVRRDGATSDTKLADITAFGTSHLFHDRQAQPLEQQAYAIVGSEADAQGSVMRVELCSRTVTLTATISGVLTADDVVEGDIAGVPLVEVGPTVINAGRTLTLGKSMIGVLTVSGPEAAGTVLTGSVLLDGGTLVVSDAVVKGLEVAYASPSFSRARFRGPVSVAAGAPSFSGCQFGHDVSLLGRTGASFHDNVFVAGLYFGSSSEPGFPAALNRSWYEADAPNPDVSFNSVLRAMVYDAAAPAPPTPIWIGPNYYGDEGGPNTGGGGFAGARGALVQITTTCGGTCDTSPVFSLDEPLKTGANRDDPGEFPRFWLQGFVVGQHTLVPGTTAILRQGRETLFSAEVVTSDEVVTGATIYVVLDGRRVDPTNRTLELRRDSAGFARANAGYRRASLTHNFVLPPQSKSSAKLELWLDASGVTGFSAPTPPPLLLHEQTLAFTPRLARPFSICVRPARVVSHWTKGVWPSPSPTLAYIKRILPQVLPVAPDELNVMSCPGIDFDPTIVGAKLTVSTLLMELADRTYWDNVVDGLHGNRVADLTVIVTESGLLGADGASLPLRRHAIFVDQGRPDAVLHELGHAAGLYTLGSVQREQYDSHPPFGMPLEAATVFSLEGPAPGPFDSGDLGRIQHHVGPSNRTYDPNDLAYDVMGSGTMPSWPSFGTASAIGEMFAGVTGLEGAPLRADPVRAAAAPAPGTKRILVTSATERVVGQGPLGPTADYRLLPGTTRALELRSDVTGERPPGPVTVGDAYDFDVFDANNSLVATRPFGVTNSFTEFAELSRGFWAATFDVPASAVFYRLRRRADGEFPIAVYDASLATQLLAPHPGDTLGPMARVAWKDTWNYRGPVPPPAWVQPLQHRLEYSVDGVSWLPLSASVAGAETSIDTSMLPAGSILSLRLTVTDGVRSAAARVDGLVVPRRAPGLEIVAPQPEAQGTPDADWRLDALVWDQGTPVEVTWASDRDGVLGTTAVLTRVRLSVGVHVLTCRVADGDGLASQAAVRVHVGGAETLDLRLQASALSVTHASAGPVSPSATRALSANQVYRATLRVPAPGAPTSATVRLHLTAPGVPEQLLGQTTQSVDRFGDFIVSRNFTTGGDGEYVLRAEITGASPNSDTANDQASWRFAVMTPRPSPGDTDGDTLPDEWETRFGLDATTTAGDGGAYGDPDGDGVSNRDEHERGTHPRGFAVRYFAEGATSGLFDTQMALLNPGSTGAVVQLRYQRSGGGETSSTIVVPAGSRRTVDPKADGLGDAEFSTVVESDAPVVVDRTMKWDLSQRYGAHTETSIVAPALTWYLAEGATHSAFNLFYLLQNPNAEEAQVRVRFLRPSGSPLEKTYALAARSRTNIWVDVEEFPGLGTALASTDVSAVFDVINGRPIIVERAMYADVPGQTFGAGHESAGITAPATEWFLAEGATGSYFDLFILVANPGPADALVEATFLRSDGTTVVRTYPVAASSRFNIWVDHEDPRLAETAVSTTLRSTNGVPIIVERAMWWPGTGWYEAHNSPGSTTTGTRWALAEGEVDPARNLETYILVANTSALPADVRVTVLFEDGTSAEQTFVDIAPKSRFNVPVGHSFPQAASRRFGAVVESLGAVPAQIVVERAMYWDAAGQRWAAGTNALATRLQ